jgi:4-diphosphocytidyl-2C-methyl-D-erythritol kinase
LRPDVGDALEALEAAGASRALVTGSGPTAFGLFADVALADRAADSLPPRYADAIVATPDTYR